MLSLCSNKVEACTLRPIPQVKCDVRIRNRARKVIYDPATGKVFDLNKNYLGQGELNGNILVITRKLETS